MIKATKLELNSSHVPMISMPDKVAAFIISAARELKDAALEVHQTVQDS
jgi:hypothetical protein